MRWFLILAVMGLATHEDDVSGAPLEISALTKRVVFRGYQLAPEEVSLLTGEFKKLKPAKKMFSLAGNGLVEFSWRFPIGES